MQELFDTKGESLRKLLDTVLKERAEYKRWYDAVQEALVVSWRLDDTTEKNPMAALAALAKWERDIALDPAVSQAAADLRDTYKPK